jgi:16S rRNA (guanine527-N7)-methyltransferase
LTQTAGWSFFLSADPRVVVPLPPPAAAELFGPKLRQVQIYAELLARAGVERGLIGPAEAERLWDRHLLNSGVVAELIPGAAAEPAGGPQHPEPLELADLGSGAGLPGLVLAIMLPDVRVILVEPMARRTIFLRECVAEIGLGNVEVCRARAEDLAGQIQAGVVTSRAVARLDRLAALASGLARPGGLVLAIKGSTAAEELAQAMPVLRELGAADVEIVSAGAGLLERPTTVVRFRTGHSSERGRKGLRGDART